jgi:hypothetical protein
VPIDDYGKVVRRINIGLEGETPKKIVEFNSVSVFVFTLRFSMRSYHVE